LDGTSNVEKATVHDLKAGLDLRPEPLHLVEADAEYARKALKLGRQRLVLPLIPQGAKIHGLPRKAHAKHVLGLVEVGSEERHVPIIRVAHYDLRPSGI
jgi:hypothetical protein